MNTIITPTPNKPPTSPSSHKLTIWLIILGITIVLSGGFGYYTYFYKPPPGNPEPACEKLGDGVNLNVCEAKGATYYLYTLMCSCSGNDESANEIISVDCMCNHLFNSLGEEISADYDYIRNELSCNKVYSCYDKKYDSGL